MSEKVRYGHKTMVAVPANGVTGVLCRSGERVFFRVYDSAQQFIDYDLAHDDLTVTIGADELAVFYRVEGEDEGILDHSPDVLGLEKITS